MSRVKWTCSSSNRDRFSFYGICGKRKERVWQWESGERIDKERNRGGNHRETWETRKIFHIFLWIYIRAIKWISRSGPLMEALKHISSLPSSSSPPSTTTDISAAAVGMRDHRYQPEFTPQTGVSTDIYRYTNTNIYRSVMYVSVCLPITDCSGIVDREDGRKAFHSVAFLFFLPSFPSSRTYFSFASCNTDPHSFPLHSSFPHPLLLLRLSLPVPIRPFAARRFSSISLSLSAARSYLDRKGSL